MSHEPRAIEVPQSMAAAEQAVSLSMCANHCSAKWVGGDAVPQGPSQSCCGWKVNIMVRPDHVVVQYCSPEAVLLTMSVRQYGDP